MSEPLLLIGASTGGVDALCSILPKFGLDCPATIIVQHTGRGCGARLREVLQKVSAVPVDIAHDMIRARPGRIVLVAGFSTHVALCSSKEKVLKPMSGHPVNGHRPSIDVLFRSAVPFGAQVRAALLTGMGCDGAKGLLDLRNAGAFTVAQDAATSVVYGMPKVAADAGAALRVCPLNEIAGALLQGQSATHAKRRVRQ